MGKTTFIRQLLGQDFPGLRIGPEPTTDKFVAVSHSNTEKVVPGNALVVQPDSPYRAFSKFGVDFLNKFEGSFCNSKFLERCALFLLSFDRFLLSFDRFRPIFSTDFGLIFV